VHTPHRAVTSTVEKRRQVADGAEPQAVADAWLAEHPLVR
jgi:hypothetical protein